MTPPNTILPILVNHANLGYYYITVATQQTRLDLFSMSDVSETSCRDVHERQKVLLLLDGKLLILTQAELKLNKLTSKDLLPLVF